MLEKNFAPSGSQIRDPQAKRCYSIRAFYHWTKPAHGE